MNPLFQKARSRLILDNPFFGTLCLRQKPTEWDEPTGAVDGKHLFYNVKWFLPEAQGAEEWVVKNKS